MKIDARIRGRPCVGETRSGDAGFVQVTDEITWVLLVDALGHGDVAADVAALALDEARGFTAAMSIEAAIMRLHARLRGGRGAAAALLRFEPQGLRVAGVGNVEVRTLDGPPAPYIATRGVLGARLSRAVRSNFVALDGAGRFLMFTDGVDRCAPLRELSRLETGELCARLLADHSVDRDDATLIHVDYRAD